MRRVLAAALTSVALGASALVAAPAATAATCYIGDTYNTQACADPTAISVSANPSTALVSASGSKAITLTAVFDDPANTMRGVDFTIGVPGGVTRYAYATGYASKVGVRKTFRATYTAYNFYRPGRHTLKAVATRDFNTTQSFTGVPQKVGGFFVKHKSTVTIYPSKYYFGKNAKVYFDGTVRGTTDASKLSVKVQFKAKGKKKFVTKQTVRSKSAGTWKSKKFKMTKSGKWRAVVVSKGYVVGSTSSALTAKIRS